MQMLVDNFNPYSVTPYITSEKKIEIIPMAVNLTLALPIEGRLKSFIARSQKTTNAMNSF